jgi:beta-ketoacyl synthase domain protein
MQSIFLDVGIINCLARTPSDFYTAYFVEQKSGLRPSDKFGSTFSLGLVPTDWYIHETLPYPYNNRINKLARCACRHIEPVIQLTKQKYGADRIGIVVGITDNGSEETNAFLSGLMHDAGSDDKIGAGASGGVNAPYVLDMQCLGLCAEYLSNFFGITGFSVTLSTACTSSAHAISRADELLKSGICDAVIAGGVDIVSDVVLGGFSALEAVDPNITIPFSKNRRGINLGEGAAFFVMAKENITGAQHTIVLKGAADNADAFHMTSPDVSGTAAAACIQAALQRAHLSISDIDYINLHGTGTALNDQMESRAVNLIGARAIPCSSSKTALGHTLGAAGAMELAVCLLALSECNTQKLLPPHFYDGIYDTDLPAIRLVTGKTTAERLDTAMSFSFAFGGNNVCLIIGRD